MVEAVIKARLEREARELVQRVEKQEELLKASYSANAHLLSALRKFLDLLGVEGKV